MDLSADNSSAFLATSPIGAAVADGAADTSGLGDRGAVYSWGSTSYGGNNRPVNWGDVIYRGESDSALRADAEQAVASPQSSSPDLVIAGR